MARLRFSKIVPFILVILLISYFAINIKVFWPKISRLLTSDSAQASILHIVDGDTILAYEDGEVKTIRFIGIDTPELAVGNQPAQCQARSAIEKLNSYFTENRSIILKADDQVGDTDQYGRYLRYVLLPDQTDLGLELIRAGLGKEMTVQEYSRHEDYKNAEQEAAYEKKGLWKPEDCLN